MRRSHYPHPIAPELTSESAQVLARLIRFDTVNPPGNERPALEYLRDYLAAAGFECELLGPEPTRQNLVARLRGKADGPVLCYLSHVDTVLADPGDWEHGPWSGDLDGDGFLWGRGALDMKSQTAAEVVAAATLARSGWRPERGDLLVVCVCDEEVGGALGAVWLCREHPEKVRCDMLINEGGGAVMPYGDRRLYGVCCGEKGTFRFSVTATGTAGHASIPAIGDNALLKLAPVLEALGGGQPGYDVTEVPAAWLRALGEDPARPEQALANVRARDPRLALLLEPTLGVTLAPTRIRASEKINVIPAHAELKVDCRVPPGLGRETALKRIHEVIGDREVAFLDEVPGNSSPIESPLMDAIAGWLGEHDPGSEVAPVILPGYTDSRTFRDAFPECVAYGFFPHRHTELYDTAPLIHSANERIDVRDLAFATRFFLDLPRKVLR